MSALGGPPGGPPSGDPGPSAREYRVDASLSLPELGSVLFGLQLMAAGAERNANEWAESGHHALADVARSTIPEVQVLHERLRSLVPNEVWEKYQGFSMRHARETLGDDEFGHLADGLNDNDEGGTS